MTKIKNGLLKMTIFLAALFATLAMVFGFRSHYEQQKNIKITEDVKNYVDEMLKSDIITAQRDFAKSRDIALQDAAQKSVAQVTEKIVTETVVPQKVVVPTTTTVKVEKPKSTKKTKSS